MTKKHTHRALNKVEMRLLKRLVPLHTLPEKRLKKLSRLLRVKELAKGDLLFREGDTDSSNYYLLVGKVVMISDAKIVDSVSAEDDVARYPLAHQLPRQYTVRAAAPVRYVKIDSLFLSKALGENTEDYLVSDSGGQANENDWMGQLLRSRVMQQIPASNIQRVMLSIERVEAKKGEIIIQQGDAGDYYYILAKGRVAVLHDYEDGKGAIEVVRLCSGDAFGEEALLTENPRNSTVQMLSDGELMRLGKRDFVELIGQPLSPSTNFESANQRVKEDATWLDLRSVEDYEKGHLPDAINLPYAMLRFQASALTTNRHYILYGSSCGETVSAAYLLTDRAFDVSVMTERLATLSGEFEAFPDSSLNECAQDTELKSRLEKAERQLINAKEKVETSEDHLEAMQLKLKDLQKQQYLVEQRSQSKISELQDLVTSLNLQLEEAQATDNSVLPIDMGELQNLREECNELREWRNMVVSQLGDLLSSTLKRDKISSKMLSEVISIERAD